jgi:hypothetical protein
MTKLDTVPCHICEEWLGEDDIVWANREGNIEQPTYPYCVPCLPSQKENNNG